MYRKNTGFTLLELLVVIAIIGILASIIMYSISRANTGGRDGGRKSQVQEIIKAVELYYTDNGEYPDDGVAVDGHAPVNFNTVVAQLTAAGYLTGEPTDPIFDGTATPTYMYCSSNNNRSMVIAVNTELDEGGSDYCSVTRGPGPSYGCDAFIGAGGAAEDLCAARF